VCGDILFKPVVAFLAACMTILYTAQWVLPVATPPIRDGAVAVHEGRIVAVGPEVEAHEYKHNKNAE
jgi:imidazolonepropionase-like amidohydrolase